MQRFRRLLQNVVAGFRQPDIDLSLVRGAASPVDKAEFFKPGDDHRHGGLGHMDLSGDFTDGQFGRILQRLQDQQLRCFKPGRHAQRFAVELGCAKNLPDRDQRLVQLVHVSRPLITCRRTRIPA